jgi:hypothetical protein
MNLKFAPPTVDIFQILLESFNDNKTLEASKFSVDLFYNIRARA